MQFPEKLPVTEIIPQLLDALSAHPSAVLRAPPGAGKTTVVPLAFLEQLRARKNTSQSSKIIITQPRRLAARSTAARLAQLHQSDLGSTIGYHVRMDRRWSRSTQVIAMTTGVLLRRLLSDPFLDDFELVILDEFHERALELDLILGMLKRLQQTVRPDLKILVMSATIECGPIAEFLDKAPVIESSGRTFDVSIRYSKSPSLEKIEASVAGMLPTALAETVGHLLVFLPGVGEIIRTHRAIEHLSQTLGAQVFQLYGDMSPAEQDQVLAPAAQRKIILATNVAETSLTIDGVTGVIDSGLVRVMRFNSDVGISRLMLESNSLASADQRAGRAGRQSPGVCFRLWTESMNRTRSSFDTPEIHRGDLSGAILQLAGMGEYDWETFPWLTPPKKASVETAQALLGGLGALENKRITDEGRRLLRMPSSPRLAKLLIAAERLGVAERGALAAALLSERDIFRGNRPAEPSSHRSPTTRSQLQSRSDSDLVDRVGRVEHVLAGGNDPDLSRNGVQTIDRAARYLLQLLPQSTDDSEQVEPNAGLKIDAALGRSEREKTKTKDVVDDDDRLRRAIGEAWPDRVARRRVGGSDRGLMVGGIGVRLAPTSSVRDAELFVCVDMEHREGDSMVRIASAIEADWLPVNLLKQRTEYFFNPTTQGVQARKRTFWGDLIIEEHPAPLADEDQAAEVLFEEVKSRWENLFPKDDPTINNFLCRIELLRGHFPEQSWPEIHIDDLHHIGRQLCRGKKCLEDVRKSPWFDFLLGMLSYEQQVRMNELAPNEWTAPSGNRIKIDYGSSGNSLSSSLTVSMSQPKIAVRLQELFGLADTPRILGGRVVCLLELLGPNYRPQQVTSDLASFWQNTYPTVRKELQRRYPKHHWPDDPRATTATRSGLKRDAN